jgi:hypothetical protein
MWSVVDHPALGDPDYGIFSQSCVPRAYVVVVDRHYDHTGTTPEPGLEPGEEMDLGPDTMKVAVSDVLIAFYVNLLCDLQLDEMIPSCRSGIWSDEGMMTNL